MGVINATKTVNTDRIACDGRALVTLGITAAPEIRNKPADIVMVLDVSGSMDGCPLRHMQLGAKDLIGLITAATGGVEGQTIGGGSRVGVVSFAEHARAVAILTEKVPVLNSAVDGLRAGGRTNHAEAFTRAVEMFEPQSPNEKIIIMFTDGNTTEGEPPSPVARAARDSGIIIYCIGLNAPVDILNDWATDPDDIHVATTTRPEELERVFRDLGAEVAGVGAADVVIREEVSRDFRITRVNDPSKGMVVQMGQNSLEWSMETLGVTGEETAQLTFEIRPAAGVSGEKKVNRSITYTDRVGSAVTFPDPVLTVECGGGGGYVPEPCPVPVQFTMDSCQDSSEVDLHDSHLQALGRIIQLDATLKNVCPGKRVALAVQLTEVGPNCQEYPRGIKAFTIPAHTGPDCRDVKVKCIRFVVPEDLDVSGCGCSSLCSSRSFKARLMANYVDTDFICCDTAAAVL